MENLLPDGYSKANVLELISLSVAESRSAVTNKRNEIRDNYKKYHNKDEDNKVYDRTIKTITKVMQAVHMKDEPEIVFKVAGYDVEADVRNLNELAKKSFKDNDRARKNKYKIEMMCNAGVALEVQKWNELEQESEYILAHPLTWLPDSNWDINYGFGYHHFELYMTKEEIAYGGFVNTDNAKTKSQKNLEKWIEMNVERKGRTPAQQEIVDFMSGQSYSDRNSYEIILSYMRFNGVPYEIFTCNDGNELLGIKEILPVTKKQKRNPYLIDFPVTVTWLKSNPFDVFGDSFWSLAGDKQEQRQLFMNWMTNIARQGAGFGTLAIDSEYIKDVNPLVNPNPNGITIVEVDTQNGKMPFEWVQQDQVNQDVYSMIDVFRSDMAFILGYDETDVGVVTGKATWSETEKAQKNKNVITKFNETYLTEGEIDYWTKWLNNYARYGTKKLTYTTSVDNLYITSDFSAGSIRKIINKVIIISKQEIDTQRKNDQEFFTIYGPMLLEYSGQDMSYTQYKIMRDVLDAYGLDEYRIEDYLNEPIEVFKGQINSKAILEGEDIDVDVSDDNRALLSMYRRLPMSKQKMKAIMKTIDAVMLKEEMKLQQAQQQQKEMPGNAQANIAQNAKIQQQMKTDKPSSEDVSALS